MTRFSAFAIRTPRPCMPRPAAIAPAHLGWTTEAQAPARQHGASQAAQGVLGFVFAPAIPPPPPPCPLLDLARGEILPRGSDTPGGSASPPSSVFASGAARD